MVLAGPAAEETGAGTARVQAPDMATAISVARALDPRDPIGTLERLAPEAVQAVDAAWPRITAIVGALLQKVDADPDAAEWTLTADELAAFPDEAEWLRTGCWYGGPTTAADVQALIDALPLDSAEPPVGRQGR